jgi:chemotaxis protein MotA
MNLGTLIGFVLAIASFVATMLMSFKNVAVVLDLHAFVIVIGSTIAVTLICFPAERVFAMLKVVFRRLLGKNRRDYAGLIQEIVMLSDAYRKGEKNFEAVIPKISDPFLKDAANAIFWIKADISPEEMRDLLETRVVTHTKIYTNEAKIFKTLAKFPPAFGLMGTSIGMIALLQSLGGENAKNEVGPAMSVALVATLYGLVLANFVFLPIAENLVEQTNEDTLARNMVVEGIMLIQANKPTKYVEEKIKSYLLPKDRGDLNKPSQK